MKRLGIFCMYEQDGIVDDYVLYLLQEIKKVLSHLMIICNGKLNPEGRARLEKYTDDIFVRENTGFDFAAWKHGILDKKNELKDYDELIFFNDSFYGPFYPFQDIFDEMNHNYPDADFWGLTIHGEGPDPDNLCPYGYVPEHLQTYFMVIRKKMLHSPEFYTYWEKSQESKTMLEAVKLHEVCFTKHFFDIGFRYAAYCDTREWEKISDAKLNHYVFSMDKLLRDYHCPIIKKRITILGRGPYLGEDYGNIPRASLQFVNDHTEYDISLIWKNILRRQNIGNVKTDFSLNYILPRNVQIGGKVNLKDAVIVAHLYYEDLMPVCVEYLCNAPKEIKIVVTVSTEDKKKKVEGLFKSAGRNCEVRLVPARGRDVSALYVGCADIFKNFKYLCFIHDKKSARVGEAVTHGEAFFRMLWNNFLPSEDFIINTLATFENDPFLGILTPPQPYHGKYGRVFFFDRFWSTDLVWNTTMELADKLKIPRARFDRNIAPPAIGNVFWCRTESIKIVTDAGWTTEDFPEEPMPVDGTLSHALERILPFAAQEAGFYTGQLMSDDFARDEIENFIYFSRMYHDVNLARPIVAPPASLNPNGLAPYYIPTLTAWVKYKVPEKYWFLLRPVKKFLKGCLSLVSPIFKLFRKSE